MFTRKRFRARPRAIIITGLLLSLAVPVLGQTNKQQHGPVPATGICEGLMAAAIAEFNLLREAAEKFIAREQISQIRALGAMFRSVSPELAASFDEFEKNRKFSKESREAMKSIGHHGMGTAFFGTQPNPGVREGMYKEMPESWIGILNYEYAKTELRNLVRSATMEVGVQPSASVCASLQQISSLDDPFAIVVNTCTHFNLKTGRFEPSPEAGYMIVSRASEKPVAGAKLGTELKENEKATGRALSDFMNSEIPDHCRRSFDASPDSAGDQKI